MSTAPKLSTTDMATMKPGASTPMGALKQVDAGLLSVGYAEAGPADGSPVLLLHGWPYDIHSFAVVTPLLASAGYRVVVPFVRGYGTTRFLSDNTLRNGQQAALAADVIVGSPEPSGLRTSSKVHPKGLGVNGRQEKELHA